MLAKLSVFNIDPGVSAACVFCSSPESAASVPPGVEELWALKERGVSRNFVRDTEDALPVAALTPVTVNASSVVERLKPPVFGCCLEQTMPKCS